MSGDERNGPGLRKQLGLPTFAQADDLLRTAREGAWGYEEFLTN